MSHNREEQHRRSTTEKNGAALLAQAPPGGLDEPTQNSLQHGCDPDWYEAATHALLIDQHMHTSLADQRSGAAARVSTTAWKYISLDGKPRNLSRQAGGFTGEGGTHATHK